jgi:cytochrome b561
MKGQRTQFAVLSRMFHWFTAVMVIAMLYIGVAMVTSASNYHLLLAIHRPLGVAILILVSAQFVNRLVNPPPPYPPTMGRIERLAARASAYTMYSLVFLLPLVGWGMLSAARSPVVLCGSLHLPFILPHNAMLYAVLRRTHTVLAYLLFVTFLAHFAAVLFHTFIVRDGLLKRMAPWPVRERSAEPMGQSLTWNEALRPNSFEAN